MATVCTYSMVFIHVYNMINENITILQEIDRYINVIKILFISLFHNLVALPG